MTAPIRATESTLKSFLGVEASAATAIASSIQKARRHAMHEHTLEEALEEVGGDRVTSNSHFAWIDRGTGCLTLYVDLGTHEYYIGAM